MAGSVNVSDMPGIKWQDRKHHLWFPLSFTKYYIEDERLMVKTGFLNTTLEETLLYRIVDVTCKQSLAGKIFGTGDIIVKTRVDGTPEIVLKNIARPMEIRRMLSSEVENARQSRNVIGKEFYGGPGMPPPMVDLDGDGIPDFEEHMG